MNEKIKISINDNACEQCLIRKRAVCSLCDDDELVRLEKIKFYKHYNPGDVIALQGMEMSFVGSIVSGLATLSQTMEDGRTQMVGLLLPSDFFGMSKSKTMFYTIEAKTEVIACCFNQIGFQNLLKQTPHLTERLLEMTMVELDAAREWLLILGRKTAREKIASILTIFVRRKMFLEQKVNNSLELDIPINRSVIADYLGLTIETVSRQFTALNHSGIIVLTGRRSVKVPDIERLMIEAGDDSEGILWV